MRISLNWLKKYVDVPVSDEEFLNAFHMVQKAAEELVNSDESYPTFFEFIFAMVVHTITN